VDADDNKAQKVGAAALEVDADENTAEKVGPAAPEEFDEANAAEGARKEEPEFIVCLPLAARALSKGFVAEKHLEIESVNMAGKAIYWDCCVAKWNRGNFNKDLEKIQFFSPW